MLSQKDGVSLIEILIGMVIVVVACIGALSYFAYGLGNVGKQGNRRAALERARERLEQLMAADVTQIEPSDDNPHWLQLTCGPNPGDPCTWALFDEAPDPAEKVTVDNLTGQDIVTTVQWIDDGASAGTQNTLDLAVKVWFTKQFSNDDNVNRVLLRTLRTP